ncbi:MAG: translocation/assembly module TamB domain-containing protein, partial [Bacteroidota bacterium]
QYLQGVDLNVDVESYANRQREGETGTTEVSLDVSKAFFNERLSVQVGGNIGINENEQESQTDLQSTAGDFAVEYKITPDGRWRAKGFNKTEYEDVLTGEVNLTGVSLIFNRDFTSFKDLNPFGESNNDEETETKDKQEE